MSVVDQLLAGLKLTLTGMVTVFVLLTFMVFVIGWMSKLAHRLQPTPGKQSMKAYKLPAGSPDPNVVSAISAAIHRYRRDRR